MDRVAFSIFDFPGCSIFFWGKALKTHLTSTKIGGKAGSHPKTSSFDSEADAESGELGRNPGNSSTKHHGTMLGCGKKFFLLQKLGSKRGDFGGLGVADLKISWEFLKERFYLLEWFVKNHLKSLIFLEHFFC